MKTLRAILALAFALMAGVPALAGPNASLTLLTGANVVSLTDGSIALDQKILVQGDRIAAVLAGDDKTYDRVHTVRLNGAYVLPGFTDSHVHLPTDAIYRAFGSRERISLSEQARALAPFLANGITSLVVMSGAPDLLTLRDAIDAHTIVGPRLVVASPMIAADHPVLPAPMTFSVLTAAAGRAAVDRFARQGYDFIKTREDVHPDVEAAMIAEANALKLPLFGHVPNAVKSFNDLLQPSGFNFAHLYLLLDFAPYNPDDPSALVDLLVRSHAAVMTTMSVHENILAKDRDYQATLNAPGAQYLDPSLYRFWTNYPFQAGDPKPIERDLERQKQLVRRLVDAGVPVLLGTDTGNPTIAPGFSFPEELKLLVEAGLSPLQVLQSATETPARIFARLHGEGCIEKGCRADLAVFAANPLLDIHNVSQLRGVMVGGTWLDAHKLQIMLMAARRHPVAGDVFRHVTP
jgi:imidazolonepropionase-like amidohydrolase